MNGINDEFTCIISAVVGDVNEPGHIFVREESAAAVTTAEDAAAKVHHMIYLVAKNISLIWCGDIGSCRVAGTIDQSMRGTINADEVIIEFSRVGVTAVGTGVDGTVDD